jgi:hypothetical protein
MAVRRERPAEGLSSIVIAVNSMQPTNTVTNLNLLSFGKACHAKVIHMTTPLQKNSSAAVNANRYIYDSMKPKWRGTFPLCGGLSLSMPTLIRSNRPPPASSDPSIAGDALA